ncbi:MAG: FHA domain-containing protein [Muribaculaceae bacterium]|nr:FHA domain-containing protein [Muribaculaceae bacterium]
MEQETYIPGLNSHLNDPYNQEGHTNPYQPDAPRVKKSQMKAPTNDQGLQTPVVGFLYSVSKNGFPEYWPLYIGQNRIGKSADMDICLREGSVSDHHANIQIKKMRTNGGRLIATIVDAGSKNGIVVNDEELDYDRHPLKNLDILTMGLNYKLIFILIDPVEMGLTINKDFVALDEVKKDKKKEDETEEPFIPENATHHPGRSENQGYSPYGNGPIQDETININGNYSGLNAGGTRIM